MVSEMCLVSPDEVRFMAELGREYTYVTPMKPVAGYDDFARWAPRTTWNPYAMSGHFLALKNAADGLGVVTLTGVEAAHLITDQDGQVIGVEDASGFRYRADKGVLLSTSSFDRNVEMSKRYNKMNYWALRYALGIPGASVTEACPTDTGDGVRMGMEAGAGLALSRANCISDICALGFDSAMGSLLLNSNGDRFVQENAMWGYVNQMAFDEAVRLGVADQTDRVHFWVIADSTAVETNGYYSCLVNGVVRTSSAAGFDLVQKADTVEELAEKIGLPSDRVAASVARWNEMVASGEDTDFHRANFMDGVDDFEPIAEPPYYALPYIPYSMGSFGGLRADSESRVIGLDGQPIPRLYAAGSIISGMFTANFYNSCGWSILGTVHWGRKAGANVAALAPWTEEPVEWSVAEDDVQAQAESAIASASGGYSAGVYEAYGYGKNGEVPVEVELSGTAIVSVAMGECSESKGIGDLAAEIMARRILVAQSADVDTVTSATLTSSAIRAAVEECIEQATASI